MLVDEDEVPRPQADQSSEDHFRIALDEQFEFLDKWTPPRKTAYIAFDDLVHVDDDLWDVQAEQDVDEVEVEMDVDELNVDVENEEVPSASDASFINYTASQLGVHVKVKKGGAFDEVGSASAS